MKTTCKRCGRELTSAKSVERGYGARCFKITRLQETSTEISSSVIQELLNRVKKLELDNNFMKHQLKHRVNVVRSSDSNLEWRKASGQRPEQTIIKVEMTVVIKELKVIFHEGFDYHEVLMPINGRTEPELPPMVVMAN